MEQAEKGWNEGLPVRISIEWKSRKGRNHKMLRGTGRGSHDRLTEFGKKKAEKKFVTLAREGERALFASIRHKMRAFSRKLELIEGGNRNIAKKEKQFRKKFSKNFSKIFAGNT